MPAPNPATGRPGHAYEAAQLRWATLADAPRLVELWRAAYPDDDAQDVAAWLEHGGALVLEDRMGRLLAALRWREEGAGWRVDRVATRPEARGQGYGRWLATKVEALAIRKNVPFLLLSLPEADAGQLAYYERLGYRVTEESSRNGAPRAAHRHLRKVVGGVWQRKATGADGRSPGGSGHS